jgi:hypothetical protein
MNNNILIFITLVALLFSACEKEPAIRFGFNTEYNTSSQGITIMHSDDVAHDLTLTGCITVESGSVYIELLSPMGEVAFSIMLNTPGIFNIDEKFQNYSGNWVLKYRSLGGKGQLTLHINRVV